MYLPGPENLELPGYRALGLLPEHLVGCEYDARVLPVVRQKAGGIEVVHGNVLAGVEFVQQAGWPRLGVANLDFDGRYNSHLQEILGLFRVFPSEPEGYLAVTSYAAHDGEAIAQGKLNLAKFYAALGNAAYYRMLGRQTTRWNLCRDMLGSEVTSELMISRELGLLWWLAVAMSIVRYPRGGYGEIDRDYLAELDSVLAVVTAAAENGMLLGFASEPRLSALLERRTVALWPTDIQRWLYHSQGMQPMWVWFFRICCVDPEAHDARTGLDLVLQMCELAERFPLIYVGSQGQKVTFE
jgi:hypothetical protein